jgi:hypothetical protein
MKSGCQKIAILNLFLLGNRIQKNNLWEHHSKKVEPTIHNTMKNQIYFKIYRYSMNQKLWKKI